MGTGFVVLEAIDDAMKEIRKAAPDGGSYLSESNFFEDVGQPSYWGRSCARLPGVKDRHDATASSLSITAAGSEHWSADGSTRLA
jgi:hypothetical protein